MARYRKHIIRYGETMQSIASLEMGDVSEWTTIAQYNQLVYPFIVDTDEEKIADVDHLVTIGDELVIPVEVELSQDDLNAMTVQDKDEISRIALGEDLSMTSFSKFYEDKGTQDSIFQLDGDNKGDLKTVYGSDNVKQAIIAKLLTPKGALILHPDYGSELHTLFEKGNATNIAFIDDEISRCILTDGRISSTRKLSSTLSAMQYESSWSVTLESMETQMDFVISRDTSGNFAIR